MHRTRFIVGKLGLDAHDNGLRIIAKWLMDSGYEVIYAGLYNTSDRLVKMAMEEGVDGIGISFLGGEHLYYGEQLKKTLEAKDLGHIKLVMGGVIPPDDVVRLREMGVDMVFTPGTTRKMILTGLQSIFPGPSETGA
jgi:methylmalonyl-CoA mutase C-terminal domain/subunit